MYEDYDQHGVTLGSEGVNSYISKVFGCMFIGLLVTALSAFCVLNSGALLVMIFTNRILFFGLLIGEFVLVAYLSGRVTKMSYTSAILMFALYSVINGITVSIVFFAYTLDSISYTFVIAALTFGIMSVYGAVTKTDLTSAGNILCMALLGLIVLSVVNWFVNSSAVQWVVSLVGLFVFLGLTAYDTQKLKSYYYAAGDDIELRNKLAISGALSLYLDFINLFLKLLRLFGKRK
mgnify:FL=1